MTRRICRKHVEMPAATGPNFQVSPVIDSCPPLLLKQELHRCLAA